MRSKVPNHNHMTLDAKKSALPDLHLAMGRSRQLQVTSVLGGLALVVLYYRQSLGIKVGQSNVCLSLFCQAEPDLQKLSLNIELQEPDTSKEEEHKSSSPTFSSVRTSCSGRQEERCTHSLTNDGASVLDSVRAAWMTWLQRQQAGWPAWCPCRGRERWRWFKSQDEKYVCFKE